MPMAAPTHASTQRVARRRTADARRGSSSQRGYGARWQRARKSFLIRNPLCASCKEQGHITEATVVDHVVPHKGDYERMWDQNSWQPLCKRCHDRKSANESGGWEKAR